MKNFQFLQKYLAFIDHNKSKSIDDFRQRVEFSQMKLKYVCKYHKDGKLDLSMLFERLFGQCSPILILWVLEAAVCSRVAPPGVDYKGPRSYWAQLSLF